VSGVRDLQLLQCLSWVENAAFNASESLCFGTTRKEIRTELIEWSESSDPDTKDIFWIYGMAGTGKSTIAVASHLNDRGFLVTSFFFSRSQADRYSASKLVNTIAFQLANASDILKRRVCDAIGKNLGIVRGKLADQWEELIEKPLQRLERLEDDGLQVQSSPIILVVDALDECMDKKDLVDFLSVLRRVKNTGFARLRVLITSREEPDISDAMAELDENVKMRAVTNSSKPAIESDESDESDLQAYYTAELSSIKEKYLKRQKRLLYWEKGQPVPRELRKFDDWPKRADILQLVKSSGRLFLYAAITCRIIQNDLGNPADRLEKLLDTSTSRGQNLDDLDEIYLTALKLSIPSDRDLFFEVFHQVVGAIVLSYDPLSVASLIRLLEPKFNDTVETDMEVRRVLDRLRSVLEITIKEEPVKVIHTSFREFLVDKKRCTNPEFQINEEEVHEHLFRGCIAVMSGENGLRKDLFNLKAPGTLIVEKRETTDGSEVVERSEVLKDIIPEL
jgi:hypothetical protein